MDKASGCIVPVCICWCPFQAPPISVSEFSTVPNQEYALLGSPKKLIKKQKQKKSKQRCHYKASCIKIFSLTRTHINIDSLLNFTNNNNIIYKASNKKINKPSIHITHNDIHMKCFKGIGEIPGLGTSA